MNSFFLEIGEIPRVIRGMAAKSEPVYTVRKYLEITKWISEQNCVSLN
jgi:hypothetical protein